MQNCVEVRCKILWSHAQGKLKIGDFSIVTGAMPHILEWIGDDLIEANASLIQYQKARLPKARIDDIRFVPTFAAETKAMPHAKRERYSSRGHPLLRQNRDG